MVIHIQHLDFFASCSHPIEIETLNGAPSMEIFSIFGLHYTSIHIHHTSRLCEASKASDACKCVSVCAGDVSVIGQLQYYCYYYMHFYQLMCVSFSLLTFAQAHFVRSSICSFIYFPFEIVSWYKLRGCSRTNWRIKIQGGQFCVLQFFREEKEKKNQMYGAWGVCWPKLNAYTFHISHICRCTLYNQERERTRENERDRWMMQLCRYFVVGDECNTIQNESDFEWDSTKSMLKNGSRIGTIVAHFITLTGFELSIWLVLYCIVFFFNSFSVDQSPFKCISFRLFCLVFTLC